MNKVSISEIIARIVIVAFVAFVIYSMATKPSKKLSSWAEKLITQYGLDAERTEDYYYGFRDAIDYAADHIEEVDKYGYVDKCFSDGYDMGYEDGLSAAEGE